MNTPAVFKSTLEVKEIVPSADQIRFVGNLLRVNLLQLVENQLMRLVRVPLAAERRPRPVPFHRIGLRDEIDVAIHPDVASICIQICSAGRITWCSLNTSPSSGEVGAKRRVRDIIPFARPARI